MTHTEKIQLIDSMIRENPDYTVKDFTEMVRDILLVELAQFEDDVRKEFKIIRNG